MIIILMNDKYINPNVIKISKTSGELGWPAIMWKHPKSMTYIPNITWSFSLRSKKYSTYGDKIQPPQLCTNNFPHSFILYTKILQKKTYLCGCTRRNIFVLHDSCAETISFRLDFTKPFTPTPRVGSASPDGMWRHFSVRWPKTQVVDLLR